MQTDFLYLFSNLNYVAKISNWSVAGCHGINIVNMQRFVFELRLLQFLANKRHISLPWQQDQNNTHFLNVMT